MAEFVCKYGTLNGEIVQKVCSADSERALRNQMEQQGFYVFGIKRKLDPASIWKTFFSWKKKVLSEKEFLIFNQELAALIRAGLPLLQSLELLMERAGNREFQRILEHVYEQVKSGTSLSDAFASHPDIFPKVYTASILAGEKSGTVEQTIRRYMNYVKILLAIRTKVISGIIYPILLLALSCGVIGILVGYVIPKFSEFYKGFAGNLPVVTQVLVSTALFTRDNALWFLPLLFVMIILLNFFLKTSEIARINFDRLKLRIPFLGNLWSKFSISQLTRTLHTLLAGGIPLVQAIDVAANAVGNRVISGDLRNVSRGVKEGEPLWSSLRKTGLMTDMAVEMVKVGEETGALDEMLKNISDFYDEEIETRITNILSIVEPVLLIFMGIVVAAILLAMYYPLFTVYTSIQ